MWFLLLLFLIPYLAIGARIARSEYTIAYRKHMQILPALESARNNAPKSQKDYANKYHLVHQSSCNINYKYLRDNGCYCPNGQASFDEFARRLAPPNEPKVPVGVVMLWPYTSMKNYITADAKKIPDYREIERLESAAGIKELI